MVLILVFNVVLVIVFIMKGIFDIGMFVIVVVVSLVYGVLVFYLVSFIFGNENVIIGEKINWKVLFKL